MAKKKCKAFYIPASIRISPFTPQTERAMRVYAASPIQEGIKKTKRKVYYGDAQPFAVGFLEGLPSRNIPPQAHVFNPERNELKNRTAGCSRSDRLQCYHQPVNGSKRKYRLPKPTRNNRSCLHRRSPHRCPGRHQPNLKNRSYSFRSMRVSLMLTISSVRLGRCPEV